MKISIIIQYSQRGSQIKLCLEGLQKQKMPFGDFEVIIVGEANDTLLNQGEMRIKYIPFDVSSYERFPFAMMRNEGAEKAEGSVLVFLDCDIIVSSDFLLNTWLEHREEKKLSFALRKKLQEDSCINSITEVRRYRCDRDEREEVCSFFGGDYEKIKTLWLWVYSHTMCINKEQFFESGRFCENLTGWGLEDSEFAYRTMKKGVPIVCDTKSRCYHVWHPENFDKSRAEGYKKNLDIIRSIYKDPVLDGLDLCAGCLEPKSMLKLVSYGMSPQALSLFLYESYVRGYQHNIAGLED